MYGAVERQELTIRFVRPPHAQQPEGHAHCQDKRNKNRKLGRTISTIGRDVEELFNEIHIVSLH
jgi:hypothetical protein